MMIIIPPHHCNRIEEDDDCGVRPRTFPSGRSDGLWKRMVILLHYYSVGMLLLLRPPHRRRPTATKKRKKKPTQQPQPGSPLEDDTTTTFTVEEERVQLRGMQAALKDTHYLVTVDPNRANLFFAVDNDGNKAELKNSRYNNTMTKLSSYQRWLNRTYDALISWTQSRRVAMPSYLALLRSHTSTLSLVANSRRGLACFSTPDWSS